MAIEYDATQLTCSFCQRHNETHNLHRSMHGLYCSFEGCYTRQASGNLVPAIKCPQCQENAFYFEEDGTMETAQYQCIACGHRIAM